MWYFFGTHYTKNGFAQNCSCQLCCKHVKTEEWIWGKMVNATFASLITAPCLTVCKCRIYLLYPRFTPQFLNFCDPFARGVWKCLNMHKDLKFQPRPWLSYFSVINHNIYEQVISVNPVYWHLNCPPLAITRWNGRESIEKNKSDNKDRKSYANRGEKISALSETWLSILDSIKKMMVSLIQNSSVSMLASLTSLSQITCFLNF